MCFVFSVVFVFGCFGFRLLLFFLVFFRCSCFGVFCRLVFVFLPLVSVWERGEGGGRVVFSPLFVCLVVSFLLVVFSLFCVVGCDFFGCVLGFFLFFGRFNFTFAFVLLFRVLKFFLASQAISPKTK